MKNRLLILCAFVLTVTSLTSQQDITFSMYSFNPLFNNPATAGYQDKCMLSALGRYQWVGIEGAPKSAYVSYQAPFKKQKLAYGIGAKLDVLGLMKNYAFDANIAYRLNINETTRLSVGFVGSLMSLNDARNSGVKVDPTDPTSQQNINVWIPNLGAGLYLWDKRFFIGASVPHIFNQKITEPLFDTSNYYSRVYRHYFASVGYVFGKEDGIKFKPQAFFKVSENSSLNLDINANLLFQERFWFGLGYRSGGDIINEQGEFVQLPGVRGESVVAMFKMMATERLEIGYAYDFPLSNLNNQTSGSHEIFLGYSPCKGREQEAARYISPRYVNYF